MRTLRVVGHSSGRAAADDVPGVGSHEVDVDELTRQIEQLRRAVAELSSRSAETSAFILARDDRKYHVVDVGDIELIEADGNYVRLKVGQESFRQRIPLSALERKLDSDRFVRVHRSIIVNLAAVRSIVSWFSGNYMIEMKNGQRVRVSRTYWQRLARRLSLE